MYIAVVPNRNSPPAILLRESFRELGKVRNRTLVNLSFLGAALLGLSFVYFATRLAVHRSNVIARQLLLASIIYLPSVFLLLLLDRS